MRRLFARFHLWLGERLGLTHYRNCWDCKHCHAVSETDHGLIMCDLYLNEDGAMAFTDPCEAVWCWGFWRRRWVEEG